MARSGRGEDRAHISLVGRAAGSTASVALGTLEQGEDDDAAELRCVAARGLSTIVARVRHRGVAGDELGSRGRGGREGQGKGGDDGGELHIGDLVVSGERVTEGWSERMNE